MEKGREGLDGLRGAVAERFPHRKSRIHRLRPIHYQPGDDVPHPRLEGAAEPAGWGERRFPTACRMWRAGRCDSPGERHDAGPELRRERGDLAGVMTYPTLPDGGQSLNMTEHRKQ